MAADNQSIIELPKDVMISVLIKLPLPSLISCCSVFESLFDLIKTDPNLAQILSAKSESQLMIHSPSLSRFHLIDMNSDANPLFAQLNEIKPIFNLPLHGFEVTHSSNGLLLLENRNSDDNIHRCVVCNPVLGEYIKLPDKTALSKDVISKNVTCAFFYCPITSRFNVFRGFHRVLRFTPDSDSDSESDINIFYDSDDSDSDSVYFEADTMGEYLPWGSDAWEPLGFLPFCPRLIYSPCNLNHVTHWLCGDNNVQNLIVSFNFETREFGEIPGPAHMTKAHASSPDNVNMVLHDGFLSIFDNYTNESKFEVWKMWKYGVGGSWARAFVIDTAAWGVYGVRYFFKPVICRNNGEVVMVSGKGYILVHDLVKKRGRVMFHPVLVTPCKAIGHIPRLVLLRDVVKDTNMEVLNVTPRLVDPNLNSRNCLSLSKTYFEL